MNKLLMRCFLLSLATTQLCGAFTVLPSSNKRILTSEFYKIDNTVIGAGLFRAYHHTQYEGADDELHQPMPNHTKNVVKRLSQKLKIFRSIISFRISFLLNNNKKMYLSIIAAAIIAAGTFPSDVTAKTDTSIDSSTSNAVVITLKASETHFDKGQDSFGSRLLADSVDASNNFKYATTADVFRSTRPVVEDVSQIIGTGVKSATAGDMMILNDKMLKKGFSNIAVVGSGAATLSLLKKRVNAARVNSGEDDDIDIDDRVQSGYEEIILADHEEKTDSIAEILTQEPRTSTPQNEAKKSCVLPLSDHKHRKAREQPKSPNKEATLAARYNSIPTVEERAYQILVDLGMIEVTN